VVDLRALLEARTASPADVSDAGVLVRSDLTGSMQLYRVPVGGGKLEQLTDFRDPVDGSFVPGSSRVLVERDDAGNERTQLYLLDTELEPLVVDPEFIHRTPSLSRDGKWLAYASNRRNGTDFDAYVRSLETGEERCVFREGYVETCDFSPDARLLAVRRATERSNDDELFLVDLETGDAQPVAAHDESATIGPPQWLPDASAFFFATSVGRDRTGVARWSAGKWEYVVESQWDLECVIDDAGRTLAVVANEDGYSSIELRDPSTLGVAGELALPGRGVTSEHHFSPNGELAFRFSSARIPGDVWLGERRLTVSPGEFDPDQLVEPTLHRFRSFDGEEVPVFLYEPRERPAPVVVYVHGGPESQLRPEFSALAQAVVASGYAVAAPNVRGSTGYGKRYEHLDDVRLRMGAVRDLGALHDWLATRDGIDASRAALFGRSYGGFMVLAGLAFQPERWAAGIEFVGISSLVTFLENTSKWRLSSREREYGSLAHDREFLEEISPLTHVDRIRAPLFIQHGANDPRVPVSESRQIHRVLTGKGIRCELLVHEDEGHQIGKLENRLETFERAAAFLQEVLG
jgi:dipeptidyl aminopeptidase/acylaminoacyl peptidase